MIFSILGFILAFYAALFIIWAGLRLVLAGLDYIIDRNTKG